MLRVMVKDSIIVVRVAPSPGWPRAGVSLFVLLVLFLLDGGVVDGFGIP